MSRQIFSLNNIKYLAPGKSLIGRFTVASLIILPLFITLSGALLFNSFKHSQIDAEQETLQAHIYLLLSQTEVDKGQVLLPEALAEPRLNQPGSGLYGFIYNSQGQELWRSQSASLFSQSFFESERLFQTDQKSFRQLALNKLESLNLYSHDIEWLEGNNQVTRLRLLIASDNAPLLAELRSYQRRTWQWLGMMTFLLILAQMVIMRWGLKPLERLSEQLADLKENKIQQLAHNYPAEIQPVIHNFNEILSHEQQQRQRYRNTMSDLAHSLKTPLAVIQSHISNKSPSDPLLQEQLDRISQIIEHQLKRAVIQGKKNAIQNQGNAISMRTMTNRLIKILDKVYSEKLIQFTNLIDPDITYQGDESDLLEAFGNILDNACKYGDNAVTLVAEQSAKHLNIFISDNGQGIPEDEQKTIIERGARGDTAQLGQGIGLSVSVEIISSYSGGLTVENNKGEPHLSGACFCVSLPTTPHQEV